MGDEMTLEDEFRQLAEGVRDADLEVMRLNLTKLGYQDDENEWAIWETLPDAEELRSENYVVDSKLDLTTQEITEMLVLCNVESKEQQLIKIRNMVKEVNFLCQKINNIVEQLI